VRKKKRVKYRSGNGNSYNSVRHNTILVSTDMLGFIGKHMPTSLVTSFRGASKMQRSMKEARKFRRRMGEWGMNPPH
jgi:hypothetical protein